MSPYPTAPGSPDLGDDPDGDNTGWWYSTDPADPDAPVRLDEYNGIRPGDQVAYENPAWRQPDGTFKTGGMDGPLAVAAIYRFSNVPDTLVPGGAVTLAILNDGEYEVNADNLRKVLS